MSNKIIPYLKIVAGKDLESSFKDEDFENSINEKKKKLFLQPEQLYLPYIDPFTFLLVNVDDMKVTNFSNLLHSISPKWIIDARVTPRLDTLGGTRSHAFKLFNSYGAEYLDLFGRLGLTTYQSADANPAFWGELIANTIKESNKMSGPYIMLFDNPEFLEASKLYLTSSLKQWLGPTVSISIHHT